ncbi:MAG TPA: cytochrome P450, partial [Mycobacterium sp.]|nr:cytochrome P450 [Mycobacterium sp.]
MQDPYPLYARLRPVAPVHRVGDSGFYLVCGWDALNEAVARVDDFSSNLTGAMMYSDGVLSAFPMGELDGPAQALATADDPDHAVHRRMLVPQLAAKRIRATEPFIAETFDRLWAQHLRDGHIEWMAAVANRLPMMVVTRLIGVPDRDVDMLIPKAYASVQTLDGLVDADTLAASGTAAMELSGYIFEQFQRAIDEGAQDNLLGDMATAYGAGEVDQLTAAVIMVTLFSAGGESTASLLGSAVGVLAEKPDIQRQLRDDPGLLGAFIEETLRFESPFRGHYRHVRTDTELGGVAL